jgi:hypothetical protein
MVTPRRPHRGHRLGLPWAAKKYLLGARVKFTDDGGVKNGCIVRWRFLILHLADDEAWEAYLRDLRREWAATIAAKRALWRQRKAAAKERAREARRRAREARKALRRDAEALPP